jgi:hypothetical protein
MTSSGRVGSGGDVSVTTAENRSLMAVIPNKRLCFDHPSRYQTPYLIAAALVCGTSFEDLMDHSFYWTGLKDLI